MVIRKLLAVSVIVMILSASALANDAYLGSVGGNVFLSKNENIQMVREDVYVKALRDSCLVNCRFLFFNSGSTITCTIGFPDYGLSESNSGDSLRGFSCFVDGKKVVASRTPEENGTIRARKHPRYWYRWQMTFPSQESVVVINDYVATWGAVGFDGCRYFSYLLGTGASWSGPIKGGRIVFDHSQIAYGGFVEPFGFDASRIRITRYEDSTNFCFSDFQPSIEDEIKVAVLAFWTLPYFYERAPSNADAISWFEEMGPAYFLRRERKDRSQLQNMINDIYARKGYVFENPRLLAQFRKKSWYKPDSTFSIEKLNWYEGITINFIEELIEQGPQ